MKYIATLGFLGMVSASGYDCHQHDGLGVESCPTDQGCSYEQDQCHPPTDNSSAPCAEFGAGSIHQKMSGGCQGGGRYYIVVDVVNEDTRTIKYCEKDGGPYCATEPEPDANGCNAGTEYYQLMDQNGNPSNDWSTQLLCDMKPAGGSSDPGSPECPPTVVADFIGANGADWEVSVNGQQPANDPTISVCPGATLRVNISPDIDPNTHPLEIRDQSNTVLLTSGGDVMIPIDASPDATYSYVCTAHPGMQGYITISSDPSCACETGSSEPPSDPGHPCDAQSCPAEFTKRSTLPVSLGNFPVKECCRPRKKGCMTQGKANYDPSAEIAGSCFDAYKSAEQKETDFVGKTTFLEKRGVHRQHAKEDFYKKIAEGKSKREAIREARAIMLETDLSEKVKDRARGIVKIAVAVNSGEDSCELGASDDNCASLDLAADRTADETTILTTEDDAGSWAVVVDGTDILVKQTKKSDGTFDMRCWGDDSWNAPTNYDVSEDTLVKTHTCHGRVFLLGSTQLACDSTTCTDLNRACNAEGICACAADADSDGVCDADEAVGCQDQTACNYDAAATDAGSCTFAEQGKDCSGNCLADADSDGVCDEVDTLIDSDGDGVADIDDLCPNEPDDCSCIKNLDTPHPKKYIEKGCCNTSPASCD